LLGLHGVVHLFDEARREILDQRQKEALFVGEVEVERALRRVRSGHDVVDRRAVVTPFGENGRRSLKDALARRRCVGPGQTLSSLPGGRRRRAPMNAYEHPAEAGAFRCRGRRSSSLQRLGALSSSTPSFIKRATPSCLARAFWQYEQLSGSWVSPCSGSG